MEGRNVKAMEEFQDENVAWILVEGGCAVYKKGGLAARENLEKWIEDSQRELKDHPDFSTFCSRMRKAVKSIPKEANIYIGEVAQSEGIGLECLLGEHGRSLYTIQTTTPEVKYYPVTKQIKKFIWQQYSIRKRLVNFVMSILMYRLCCLENILKILVKETAQNDALSTGEFSNLIGSKLLKSSYAQESEQVFQVLTTKHQLKAESIKKRSKHQDFKRAVELDSQVVKELNNINPATNILSVAMHSESKKAKSSSEKSQPELTSTRISKFFTHETKNSVGNAVNMILPEIVGSDTLITNFYKLKDTLMKLRKRKQLQQTAEKLERKNTEIHKIIDEYSARTKSTEILNRYDTKCCRSKRRTISA